MAKRVFKFEEDKRQYGFTERALDYMALSVSSYRHTLKIQNKTLIEEDDYVKVDDTWLKIAKIMIDSLRYQF